MHPSIRGAYMHMFAHSSGKKIVHFSALYRIPRTITCEMERWAPFLPEGFIGFSTGESNASNFDDINQANKHGVHHKNLVTWENQP